MNTISDIGATESEDFIGVSKMVTFSGATTEAVRTCPITVIDNTDIEEEESFNVTISGENVQIDPLRRQSRITIADDDGMYMNRQYSSTL